mmetsp:Transcript_127928/g.409060  ORF Transcript_127928/g.409060 Transcript_127928/m.409060 type:complete len:242 (+) Transcript_127928:1-726(+)
MESNDEPQAKDNMEKQDLGDLMVAKPVVAAGRSMLMQLQSNDKSEVKDNMEQQNLSRYKVAMPVTAAGQSMLGQLQEATAMQVVGEDQAKVACEEQVGAAVNLESDGESEVMDTMQQANLGEVSVESDDDLFVEDTKETSVPTVLKIKGESKVVRWGLLADAWPPSAAWPRWWSQMPSAGFDIIVQLCELATPYPATVLAIELMANEKFILARLASGLSAGAACFERLNDILVCDIARCGG